MPPVTRKTQATRQQRREQIELQLLEATERLMGDGTSFTELSVDRLATEAGISRASFYIYFEDKGDLLRRLAGQVFGDLSTAGQRWWNVSWRHNPGDVQAAMADIIASYRRHQPVLVALNEVAAYEPATAQTYHDLLGAVTERMTRVIEEGQDDGSIRRELTAPTTASALVWMVERACQQNLPVKPPEYDTELAATLAEIVWGALYLKASR
ncbi:TetR/AcrR family transcriptional regulator [Mycobacterium szulgai]|uniref:TetR family transcriptional regulator n=1 Tax=Mycobacterium szulgai TaxID=1787 RepID=A0A1X2F3S9_MYCSZ|nr:TetR/AcrR family transcriptional regulator [Mycobacterium szulgai]MCV7079505.1 TetR/AcrR family transcriptional regulator [Mycobacterium szulgai]ORX13091.1 TetR family transcriptional regulator [Mycobacterium szulgai]